MAVIAVTKKDLAMNTVLERQWVSANISKVEGPTAAKSGRSYNYTVTYTLSDACDAPGKEITITYNDTRGFGDLHPVFAAVRGISLKEIKVGELLDTDELQGQDLDVLVIPDVYLGQPKNSIGGYLPLGKGDNKTAF